MDSRICQTSTASPAEPGGLSCWASNIPVKTAHRRNRFSYPHPLGCRHKVISMSDYEHNNQQLAVICALVLVIVAAGVTLGLSTRG